MALTFSSDILYRNISSIPPSKPFPTVMLEAEVPMGSEPCAVPSAVGMTHLKSTLIAHTKTLMVPPAWVALTTYPPGTPGTVAVRTVVLVAVTVEPPRLTAQSTVPLAFMLSLNSPGLSASTCVLPELGERGWMTICRENSELLLTPPPIRPIAS